ncbi:hypothetical protein IRZ71_05270 [Flavobacterium sp. ANB]|uniref:hypothetical protein n=1 Tax=unclassified Flavobacterium TaxID=196869 RepID=UPI0012B74380|nr:MULTISPECIES: hypothetical protein [unclassified Flavobacterium]MBF4515739.1 hypothetical protein [Flavobacterium sp. ANB]MTD68742.1 hypothetical protein [Flavobacterium sp. LC2016-13]
MQEKRLLKKLNFIELYQIFGGIIGFLFTIYLILTENVINSNSFSSYILIVFPFLFFAVCIYSGILINRKRYIQGLNLVIFLLFLQLVSFQVYGIFYTSINGIGINFTLDLTNDFITGFDLQPSQFLIAVNGNTDIFHLKFNLFAVGMLLFTFKILKELKLCLYSII